MANHIHPTAIIEGDVTLGDNNQILPYTVLRGPLKIGDGNIIGPHVVIGSPGADTRDRYYDSSKKAIEIGNRNIIREFSSIQKPCYKEITRLGSDIFVMAGVQIQHDAILEDQVTVTANVALAGLTHIMRGAYLGMGCTIHQFSVVGSYSIVATGASVVKNVRPFTRYVPGKKATLNRYAVDKYGFATHESALQLYVDAHDAPSAEPLRKIIETYNELHTQSKRSQY
jgi:UDP-N-acetylglucosamine acyltransferase